MEWTGWWCWSVLKSSACQASPPNISSMWSTHLLIIMARGKPELFQSPQNPLWNIEDRICVVIQTWTYLKWNFYHVILGINSHHNHTASSLLRLISVTVADLVQQLSTKTTCQSLPLTDGTAFIPNLQPALNLHEFLYYIHEALTSCEIQLNYVKSRCLESQAPKTTSRIAVLVMVSKLALGFRSFHICCNCKCCRDSSCCKWVGWQWV